MVPIRVMPGRVLIQPDIERQTVEQVGDLYVAKTLEAAVEGEDAREAWYSGTVVAVNASDTDFDVRPFLRRKVRDLLNYAAYSDLLHGCEQLLRDVDDLPLTREPGFRVGDAVTFAAQAGHILTIDGETYLMLAEHEVLGVLERA